MACLSVRVQKTEYEGDGRLDCCVYINDRMFENGSDRAEVSI